jgi:ribose 5-phosphate isomerase A
VVPFGWQIHLPFLAGFGARPVLRTSDDGGPFLTDDGLYILDCHFEGIDDAVSLDEQLNSRPGIVENGLFLGLADVVVVGTAGGVEVLAAP